MFKKLIWLLLTLCLFFLNFSSIFGEPAKGDIAVQLNYPGLGVKYFLSNNKSIELRAQKGESILLGGIRGCYYIKPEKGLFPFAGLEVDFVTFEGEISKGNGIACELFVGGEYFLHKRFSIQIDLGPALILLKDENTPESVGGLEYVLNFAINYYFFK